MPAASLVGQVKSHTAEIESLQQQYLAAKNPEQRKQFVVELKALAKSCPASDASTLNAAVSAMLPAADSTWEAEELLTIGAANPVEHVSGTPGLPTGTEYLVDARRVAQEASNPSGDVETLADIRIDQLQQDSQGHDGLASAFVQKVWRINSVQGAKVFSPRTIMYSGMSETLSLVRAQVLKSDGRVVDATASADQPVMERGASMYFDARARQLRFSHLQPGDLVEVQYRLQHTAEVNPWTGYYAQIDRFRDSFPTRLLRRVLIAPTSMKLYVVERGLSPALVRQNGTETTRIWEAQDLQSQEALSPEEGVNGPYLRVSTIDSIQEFGRLYSQLLEPELQLDENLRSLAHEILARNLTTMGKVQAVYESVKRRTKYTGFEFGVHSYQPYPVSTVERRGFGDCKDKAAMLVALLRAVGVPSEFAMVRTRSAGAMTEGAYSLQLFDHAMVYVPELNLFLDGTSTDTMLDALPPNDQGAIALTVDALGNATRRTVPFSRSQTDLATQPVQAHLAGDSGVAPQAKSRVYIAEQSYPAVKIAQAVADDTGIPRDQR